MAYRFVNPAPVFQGLSGATNVPGGSWTFYVRGSTSTLKPIYLDDEGTLAANPVVLGTDSRLPYPVWLDGEYTAELRDDNDALITTQDLASEVPAGLNLPPLNEGEVLSGDGTNYIALLLRQLPDPTGSAGYEVYTDGEQYLLRPTPPPPVVPEPDVVRDSNGVRIGTTSSTTKARFYRGTATAAASGTKTTSVNVTYPTAFSSIPFVIAVAKGTGFTSVGYLGDVSVSNESTTGCTINYNTNHGEANADGNISSSVPFNWFAFGDELVVE